LKVYGVRQSSHSSCLDAREGSDEEGEEEEEEEDIGRSKKRFSFSKVQAVQAQVATHTTAAALFTSVFRGAVRLLLCGPFFRLFVFTLAFLLTPPPPLLLPPPPTSIPPPALPLEP
jgi:hypothetical protein